MEEIQSNAVAFVRAIMKAYGLSRKDTTESSCVAQLMEMYQEMMGGKK